MKDKSLFFDSQAQEYLSCKYLNFGNIREQIKNKISKSSNCFGLYIEQSQI